MGDLCEEVGVQGFPTIKFGDPNNLEDYEGGRDLKALQTFAKEKLGPSCGPKNVDLCDADKKKQLDEFMAMSDSDLAEKISDKKKEIKESGLGLMKSVSAHKKSSKSEL